MILAYLLEADECRERNSADQIVYVIQIHTTQMSTDVALNYGMAVIRSSSNVRVRYGSSAQVFLIANAATGGSSAATNANWRLVIRVWA